MDKYDFSGWATRNDLKCSDGRTIRKDAFKHCDGQTVPIIWNHQHNDAFNVLGHAVLENREEGVYTYGTFNDSEAGQHAKLLVQHGDVNALSIYANGLKQNGGDVIHGNIKEVSLVLAGANPGAFIDNVMSHGEESEEEAVIYNDETIELFHAEEEDEDDEDDEETVADVIASMNDKQQKVFYAMVGQALAQGDDEEDDEDEKEVSHSEESEGGEEDMKKNVFEKEETKAGVLCHSDQEGIINMAKQSNVGSLQAAIKMYAEQNDTLKHMYDGEHEDGTVLDALFPDYKLVKPGAPDLLERDLSWVGHVINGTHKSPISRIRTRQADARVAEMRGRGYNNRQEEKALNGNIKLITRTTDPQTIYVKDTMHRDDIIDMTDFDPVQYMWTLMKHNLEEELARAILIGDGREDGDEHKIYEEHIRSIYNDKDLYTIHYDVDMAAEKAELQGTNTGANFSENYIYAEAIIKAALYSRENYKGSGALEFYCTPHLLNVMLLARDLNGRRIYSSKSDLAAALNVTAIHTVEQFEGQTRTDDKGKQHKLLGIFVNLKDYQVGCTKGGEITKFNQFDIDFNQYKYLIETRLSGALTKPYSAIALEEPVGA